MLTQRPVTNVVGGGHVVLLDLFSPSKWKLEGERRLGVQSPEGAELRASSVEGPQRKAAR